MNKNCSVPERRLGSMAGSAGKRPQLLPREQGRERLGFQHYEIMLMEVGHISLPNRIYLSSVLHARRGPQNITVNIACHSVTLAVTQLAVVALIQKNLEWRERRMVGGR